MRLYEIWCTSVEAIHHFLSAAHLAEIDELVRNHYLPNAILPVAVGTRRKTGYSYVGKITLVGASISIFTRCKTSGLPHGQIN
jgi:hypothetical protein